MARYQKYDVSTKVALVEEYIERNKYDPGYSMAQFSLEKGIPDSTFNNWILKYKHDNFLCLFVRRAVVLIFECIA